MKPDQHFQNMIAALLPSRQKTVSNLDLVKHRDKETAFYAITKMTVNGSSVVSQTQPFSDQTIIEMDRGSNILKVTTDGHSEDYRKVTQPTLADVQGKNLLHWQVMNNSQQQFTLVKLMSDDGYVQIKLISADQTKQTIYTVCELPNQ